MSTAAGTLGLTTRPATTDDEPFLRALFETAKPELQLIPLPPEQLRALIDMQWRAQRAGYATTSPGAADLVLELDGVPVGRLLLDRGTDAFTVVDLAVLPQHRGHGIASAAVTSVIEQADAQSLPVRLHVSNGSPAYRLYERLGFVPAGGTAMDVLMERRAT